MFLIIDNDNIELPKSADEDEDINSPSKYVNRNHDLNTRTNMRSEVNLNDVKIENNQDYLKNYYYKNSNKDIIYSTYEEKL